MSSEKLSDLPKVTSLESQGQTMKGKVPWLWLAIPFWHAYLHVLCAGHFHSYR